MFDSPIFKDDGHHSMAENMGNLLGDGDYGIGGKGGFIRLVDLVKNQAMFLVENDTWFSDFIFPGRFILWFVSMISHPEPDVFCRPKIMAVQLGLSEAR